jgi:O-succinylhomoserine sulfhydrylase
VYLAFARHTGPNLSPFNAWVVLKSLETLDLRVRRQCENALKIATFLETRVPRVLYPGLKSHPQYALAQTQMSLGGTIIALFVDGGRPQAHAFLDGLELIDISNNLGDTRSLMTHPASTTHAAVSADVRAEMDIAEGMLRFSVGLEDPADIIEDLDQALARAGL